MPPRKKAAASDGAAPAPTRSSARNKTAAAATASAAASSKPDSKRRRADDSSDDDAADSKKPLSKKAKKAPASKKAAAADDDDDKDDGPPAKMVTVLKRGRAPVDAGSNKVNTHQVYANDEGVWDAMLNQTNIGDNNNKFYVLQLLHPIGNESQCILFTRWGRVGADGQTQVKGPWAASTAINEFKKQFKSKASVPWENRVGMVPKAGKYTWIERDYGDDDEDDDQAPGGGSDSKGKGKKSENSPVPTSKLEPEIQELCSLIFSTAIIDATLSSMNYDANKLPLGKLAKSTILNGFAALKTLSDVINAPQGDTARENGGFVKACETLSSRYYSIIPHDFGRNRPVSINSKAMLDKELELVDALGDMEIASKLIAANKKVDEDAEGNPINPMDKNFHSLNLTSMAPVKRTSAEFDVLDAYVRDTHGHTHGHIRAKITSAFRVERAAETAAWNEAGHDKLGDGERLLLWHGSRCTNFTGILSQGLRIAPPEAPVTGYMFGKGVYFADMMSKSAGYCYSHLSHNTGILLLCEVAAKPFYERVQAEYDADKGCKQNKAKCTLGLGKSQPKNWKDAGKALGHDELVGCHMPDGPAHDVVVPGLNGGWGLQYNEYIVYSTAQIRVRYLLMVKMN